MNDRLAELLDDAIDPEWRSGHQPVYKLYDLLTPHCAAAVAYRQVGRPVVWRYRCRHEVCTADPT